MFARRPFSRICLGLLAAILATQAIAKDGVGSTGGGSRVAARFVEEAKTLSHELHALRDETPAWFKWDDFDAAVGGEGVKVLPVTKLDVSKGRELEKGIFLDAFFTRFNAKGIHGTIQLVEKNLEPFFDDPYYYASNCHLILHEYLGILGLEKHGQYARSAELLALLDRPIRARLAYIMIPIQNAPDLLGMFGDINLGDLTKASETLVESRKALSAKYPGGMKWNGYVFGGRGKVEWHEGEGVRIAEVSVTPQIRLESGPDDFELMSEFTVSFFLRNGAPSIELDQDELHFSQDNLMNFVHAQALATVIRKLNEASERGPAQLARLLGGTDERLQAHIAKVLAAFKKLPADQQTIQARARVRVPGLPIPLVAELKL